MHAIVILLLAIPIAPALAIGSPTINKTCAAITPPGDYDCLGMLSGDPAAMAATDARGLAAAAMNTTARKAASTSRLIADLTTNLSTCRGYYTTMVELLGDVLVYFRAGNFSAALDKAYKAVGAPMDCEKLLVEGNAHKNPFSAENGENGLLANQTVAAIANVTHPADPAAMNATDARIVAVAAINITAHKANSTLQVMAYLINDLNTCHEIYGDMEEMLASILTDFGAGRFYGVALDKAIMASTYPDGSCDIELFEGNAHKDPISEENSNNASWADLATSILKSIVIKRQREGLNG